MLFGLDSPDGLVLFGLDSPDRLVLFGLDSPDGLVLFGLDSLRSFSTHLRQPGECISVYATYT